MILGLITQSIGGDAIKQISRQIGADEESTENAFSAVIPLLMGAITKNSGQQAGAESLSRALERDHDGSVLGNFSGLLSNPDSGNGAGILKHVLGSRQNRVESTLSKTSGLDASSIGKLLQIAAPLVMGALGQAKQKSHLNPSGLSSLLNGEMKDVEKKGVPTKGLLSLLDSDNDGDVMDDIAKIGSGLLGKLF